MSGLNYLTSRYIPVLLSGGGHGIAAPWEMVALETGDVPIAPRFSDSLLNPVAIEMLAGFLQMLMPPESEAEWAKTWRKPPSPADIKSAFMPAKEWFNLRGPIPAFQDASLSMEEIRPTSRLFHVVPEGQENAAISEEAAMVALYAMQTHAFSGGRGYRTSLTGGGPLRTTPLMGETMFLRAWALVLPREQFARLGKENAPEQSMYLWRSPPKSTDVIGAGSYPACTVYWSTPRRFLLPKSDATGICPLTGFNGRLLTGIQEKTGGANYPSEQWRHPLTPYMQDSDSLAATPIRAVSFSNGIGWRDRAGLVAESGNRKPAEVVSIWKSRCRRLDTKIMRLHAYGARCDKAKVVGILDSVQPFRIAQEEYDGPIEAEMASAARAADEVAGGLRTNLGEALCHQPQRSDWLSMADVLSEGAVGMWTRTEIMAEQYFEDISAVFANSSSSRDVELMRLREAFVSRLRRVAVGLFDEIAESSARQDPMRVYGRRRMLNGLNYWPSVRNAIGLPIPETVRGAKNPGKAVKTQKSAKIAARRIKA